MILVKTLVNLKTEEATNILMPYILGQKECDTMVRLIAMNSLAHWNAYDNTQSEQVNNKLHNRLPEL